MAKQKNEKQHKKDGTYRASRHKTVPLAVSIPPMPPDMSPAAQAQWHTITQLLFSAGYITDLDGVSMRLLCESIEIYVMALDDVRENGITLQTQKGCMQNPALGAKNTAWKQIHTICKQYGMTAIARTGLAGNENPDEDETDTLLFGLAS